MTFVLSPTGTAGQARLSPGTGSVGFTDPCFITVQDTYSERFLVGPGHWHPERHWFGPYSVEDNGSILLSTEIVNEIEEYTAIRISIGAQTATVEWPDTIVPSPGGKVAATVHTQNPITARPARVKPESEPEPEQAHADATTAVDAALAKQDDVGSSGGKSLEEIPWLKWFLILLIVSALALVALWHFRYRQPAPEPPVAEISCDFDGLTGTQQSMADLRAALTGCGAQADLDGAFVALEDRERASDPEALLVFGHLYNADHTDALFEDTLGIALPNDPADALRYYARAADAGHPEASQFVETMCASLYAQPVRSDTDAAALQSHCTTP